MAAGSPMLKIIARMPSQRPRNRAGMNSVTAAYPTTFSAPRPRPIKKRMKIRTFMFQANPAATEASPKTSRFI